MAAVHDVFDGHPRGTREYRQVVVALFAAGFATFAQIFDAQAVLPALAADLDLTPATAALAVSSTTVGLALSVLVWASVSDRIGRTRAMAWSLVTATVLSFVAPLMPTFEAVVAVRAGMGVALGAVPAVAMAYLNEEVRPGWVPVAAGTYIAGNTIGGVVGATRRGTALGVRRVADRVVGRCRDLRRVHLHVRGRRSRAPGMAAPPRR